LSVAGVVTGVDLDALTIVVIVQEVAASSLTSALVSTCFVVVSLNISKLNSSWATFLTSSKHSKNTIGSRGGSTLSTVYCVEIVLSAGKGTFGTVGSGSVRCKAMTPCFLEHEEFASFICVAIVSAILYSGTIDVAEICVVSTAESSSVKEEWNSVNSGSRNSSFGCGFVVNLIKIIVVRVSVRGLACSGFNAA